MLYTLGHGRYESEYKALWQRYVPASGQADTVQGELVRVIGKLANQYYRNGRGNWNRGYRMLTNILWRHLRDPSVFGSQVLAQVESDITAVRAWGSGRESIPYTEDEDPFDRITDRVVEWCQGHPHPIPNVKNPKLNV